MHSTRDLHGELHQRECRETLTSAGEGLVWSILWRSTRGLGTFKADSGAVSFSTEESFCEDGRLPESTAHCNPKKGTPELLSICMKERSYAQPERVRLIRQTMNEPEEYFNISENRVTRIENSAANARNGLRR